MKKKSKRVMVDLSATLIHNGHIRLLKKAKKFGKVIVALTKDSEVKKCKGYVPELNFNQRKEILIALKYVDKVIPSNWYIKNSYLKRNKIDILIRGSDHAKQKFNVKKIIYPRTKDISSSIIRKRASKNYKKQKRIK